MNQSFFIAAVGAHQQQKSMNVAGNNIANVNTHGFKAERSRFAGLMCQNLTAADGQERFGVGTRLHSTATSHAAGAIAETGRRQDYAIDGEGFFALVDLNSGEVSFTRNGAFSMASLERSSGLADENGQPIMETVYYLSDGEGRFVLGTDGAMIEMTDPNEMQEVGIFDYANYDGMEHQEGTRFIPVDKNGGLTRAEGVLRQGMLEISNVDLAQELTKVIESQRAYSMALRMMTTSDEIESTINSLRG